jgi:signal transduction histidine kinase
LFEELWKKSIDAKERISEIEEGTESEFVEVITDGEKAGKLLLDLAKSITKEAQMILVHPKAMYRVKALGMLDYLVTAANKGADIRIISPISTVNSELIKEILLRAPTIKIIAGQHVDAGLFIADGKRYARLEVKNVEADDFSLAISRIIYSNSKIGVSSFRSFFEILWQQIDLYEKLRIHDKMQTEFANIAAHELRTPIQPILGVVDMLKFRQTFKGSMRENIDEDGANDSTEQGTVDKGKARTSIVKPMPSSSSSSKIEDVGITASQLAILDRNARRLQRLSSEILDATRIEAGTLKLDKEMFDINMNVKDVAAEATSWIPVGQNIEIEFHPAVFTTNGVTLSSGDTSSSFIRLPVIADKLRIFEVVSNLIRNAIKFSDATGDSKIITISTEKKEDANEVIVSVKDQGVGISAEMVPLLFTKFATEKEKGGIGLGLFIAKNIIEAHGGRIWGNNNPDGQGATFAFTLPLA